MLRCDFGRRREAVGCGASVCSGSGRGYAGATAPAGGNPQGRRHTSAPRSTAGGAAGAAAGVA